MNCLLLGLMAAVFGSAIVVDGCLLKWAGLLGVVGGISTAASGVVICHAGFSGLAMAINMPAVAVLALLGVQLVLGRALGRRHGPPPPWNPTRACRFTR